jgi:hypothetical protein
VPRHHLPLPSQASPACRPKRVRRAETCKN